MRKFFQLAVIMSGLFAAPYCFAQGYANNGNAQCCDPCAPADHPCGDCCCMYCHYDPCYYNEWKCCDVPYTTCRTCCRQVPKYYEVQKCRYVPSTIAKLIADMNLSIIKLRIAKRANSTIANKNVVTFLATTTNGHATLAAKPMAAKQIIAK